MIIQNVSNFLDSLLIIILLSIELYLNTTISIPGVNEFSDSLFILLDLGSLKIV